MRPAATPNSDRPAPLIVHIIYALGTGGLENGLVNIINRCPPSRYRHAIICLTRAEHFASRITAPGVEIIELNKKPGHDPAMYWRLWRQLRRLRPAVVHTRNLAALETQILGLFMPGCKRVHGEHGRDMNDLDGSNSRYRLLRRAMAPLLHRVIAVSKDLSRWLVDQVEIPAAKVTQIYNGVDRSRFHPRAGEQRILPADVPAGFFPAGDGLVLGSVGRLAAVKDQQLLLSALVRIVSARPQLRARLRLMVVGDGPERAALEARIAQLNLADCVWLAGDREDIPDLLRCMDVFLLPSLGEGISNTILEAMASGLPVIATATGGNPELVDHGVTGLLVAVGDAVALAHAIERLLDHPDQQAAMGRGGLQRIRRNFDWDQTLAAYLQVYDDVLQHRGRQPHPAGY